MGKRLKHTTHSTRKKISPSGTYNNHIRKKKCFDEIYTSFALTSTMFAERTANHTFCIEFSIKTAPTPSSGFRYTSSRRRSRSTALSPAMKTYRHTSYAFVDEESHLSIRPAISTIYTIRAQRRSLCPQHVHEVIKLLWRYTKRPKPPPTIIVGVVAGPQPHGLIK